MTEIRTEVLEFCEAMEKKLRTKDADLGATGWLEDYCNITFLCSRLEQELKELKAAILDCNPRGVSAESVDVANFAMMIYSRAIRSQEEL